MIILRALICHINAALSFYLSYSFILELLSALQITHLLLKTMAPFISSRQFILNSLFKNIPFLTGGFEINEETSSGDLVQAFWCIFAVYLVCFTGLHLFAFIQLFWRKKVTGRVIKILAQGYTIHARVLYFPIQFLFTSLFALFNSENDLLFYNRPGWMSGMVILTILNNVFAVIKESVIYQTTQSDENALAAKNNYYHQMILLYKIALILMLIAGKENKTVIQLTSVIHFILWLGIYLTIRRRLPFYNFKIFQFIIVLLSINFNISFLSMIQVFATNHKVHSCVDFMVLLFPLLAVKIMMLRIRWAFENILKGGFVTPEYAIHYGLLLQELLINSDDENDSSFLPNKCLAKGAIALDNQDLEVRVYEKIIEKLEYTLSRHPKNELLMIYMADIFATRMGNIPKFLELLRRLEVKPDSIRTKNKINEFYTKIHKVYEMYNEEKREEEMDLATYFRHSQQAKFLKDEILEEIKEHIGFWTDIQGRVLDVKRTVDKALNIDKIHRVLEKHFRRTSENIRETFPQILLMYGVYLNNVRYQASEAAKLFRKFELLNIPFAHENRFSDTTSAKKPVVAILSLDKMDAGKIIDISGPLDDVFHMTKTKLIGMNFGCLFPTAIAKTYQEQISDYAKLPKYKLDHKYKTYGKTADGEILEIEAHFHLYCYFNQEITVALLIKRKSEPQMVCIASVDGTIVDSSKDFKERLFFEIFRLPVPTMIQELSSQFDDANQAFNSVYMSADNMQQLSQALSRENIKQDPISRFTGSLTKNLSSLKLSDQLNNSQNLLTGATTYRGDGVLETARPLKELPSLTLRERTGPDSSRIESQGGGLTNEKALMLCQEFMKGKEMTLNPRISKRLLSAGSSVVANVKIRPYVSRSEVYKIIILSDVKKDGQRLRSNSEEMDTSQSLFNETFADEFPVAAEKVILVAPVINILKGSEGELPKGIKVPGKEVLEEVDDLELNSKSFSFEQQDQKTYFNEENKTQKTENNKATLSDNQDYRESFGRDTKIMKALQVVSAANTLHPALRISIVIVYAVIIAILSFVAANYVYSKHSIAKIEKGINIMYLEGQRITSMTTVWYSGLYLYLQAKNPGVLNPFLRVFFKGEVAASLRDVLEANNNLKDTLFSLGDDKLLHSAFEDDIIFWNDPAEMVVSNTLDTFSSTDLLVNKYLEFTKISNISDLLLIDSLHYTFNNTANDYMSKSRKMSFEAEEFLRDIITANIRTIIAILASENFSLILFCVSMIGVALVIRRVFQRLFRVLMRLEENGVLEHLAQLKKVRTLLDEDIDSKQFAPAAVEVFEGSRKRVKVAKNSTAMEAKRKTGEYKLKAMDFQLVKIAIGACLFVPVIAGIFAFSLNTSMNNFHGFEKIKQQIFLLSEIHYYSYLFVSIFNYNLLFSSDSNFTVLGKKPNDLLSKVISEFTDLNRQMLTDFLPASQGSDDFTITAVRDDVCTLFVGMGQVETVCHELRFGGLYSVGVEYSEIAKFAFAQYEQNKTQANALNVLLDFSMEVYYISVATKYGYPFLSAHQLEILADKTSAASKKRSEFLGIICTVMALYSLFLYFVPLKMFMQLDIARRRILNIIPYRIIQDNRMLGYYIVKEFPKEIVSINNIF